MPKGPQGQKRPADVIGAAVRIAKIATGEIEDYLVKRKNKKNHKNTIKPKPSEHILQEVSDD